MIPLAELQYETGGLVFGRGTPYAVANASFQGGSSVGFGAVSFGTVAATTVDAPLPQDDAVRFGRDLFQGRTVTFNLHVLTPGQALDALAAIATVWEGGAVRSVPGAVQTLRMCRNGRTRRVYGRPRQFASTAGRMLSGWIPATAQFATADRLFYDDVDQLAHLVIAPSPAAGILAPLSAPLHTGAISSVPGTIVVGGTLPTWLVMTVNGPISLPVITAPGWTVGLNVNLNVGETIQIDPRPWARSVVRNGAASVAGAFTAVSPRMSAMMVSPGAQQVVLSGADPTGTASLDLLWNPAYPSP